ncbi:MAG TPA: TIGR04211 family SH3 domain-containing protein [Gammaproteobacteria bacterium]|nr:TIGR04211 family SH3 domain-containing protein [Gammaproteobacteria bacterium]
MKRLLPILLIAVSLPVCAKTAYISDQLKITMRSGESTTHKVIKMLPSGMQVNVIGQNSKTGYSKIRLPSGSTGYVLTRMVLSERPARERLAEAEKQLQMLRQEPDKLGSQLATLQDNYQTLQRQYDTLALENEQLNSEIESLRQASAEPMRIARERDQSVEKNRQLNDELATLKLSNQRLTDKTEQNWFMIGAVAIVVGILLGLILPRLRVRRRRSEWGDF